jgi:hypothetical protein
VVRSFEAVSEAVGEREVCARIGVGVGWLLTHFYPPLFFFLLPPLGQTKPVFKKKAKTTKKIVLRLECTSCGYKHQHTLKRCKVCWHAWRRWRLPGTAIASGDVGWPVVVARLGCRRCRGWFNSLLLYLFSFSPLPRSSCSTSSLVVTRRRAVPPLCTKFAHLWYASQRADAFLTVERWRARLEKKSRTQQTTLALHSPIASSCLSLAVASRRWLTCVRRR